MPHGVTDSGSGECANDTCFSVVRGLITGADFWCGVGDRLVKCLRRRASNTEDGVPAFGCATIFSVSIHVVW